MRSGNNEQAAIRGVQYQSNGAYHDGSENRRSAKAVEEEGVEVVLDSKVTTVMDSPDGGHRTRSPQGQNVFRGAPSPHAVRPRAMRPPSGSGSFPSSQGEYPPHPMTVPYNPSGSFEEAAPYYHYPQQHHSPHVQYPSHGGRYPVDDVNVISPSHGKGDSPQRPPRVSQSRAHPGAQYYQYPPRPLLVAQAHPANAPTLTFLWLLMGETTPIPRMEHGTPILLLRGVASNGRILSW